MKISILMPTYDCPPHLMVKSLGSIVNQTHQDFEIIIKDGCVDNPAINDSGVQELINSLGSRVKYILSPDGPSSEVSGFYKHNGFYEALDACVEASTGDVLSLLCSDDETGESDTFEYVNQIFTSQGSTPSLVYGQCEWINADGSHNGYKTPPSSITYEQLLSAYTLYTPALFWSKSIHDRFGLFDYENFSWCADLDFWLRCWKDIQTTFAPKVLGKYRTWETSQCLKNNLLVGAETTVLQRKHSGV